MIPLLNLAAATLLAWAPPSLSPDQIRERFETANTTFQQAVELPPEERDRARALIDQSIASWRSIVTEGGVDNASLHTNIANAEALNGSLGRAVASYLRAERLDPRDESVRAGLAAARAKVNTTIAPAPASRFEEALLSWRGVIPRSAWLVAAVACYVSAWIFVTLRLSGVTTRGRTTGVVLSLAAILAAAPLVAEECLVHARVRAVVVAPNAIGRMGPSDGAYQPSFKDPLPVGAEALVIETRQGWAHLKLADGRETWLRAEALEYV